MWRPPYWRDFRRSVRKEASQVRGRRRFESFETTGADSKNDLSGRLSTIIRPSDRLSVYLYGQAAAKRGFTENLVNKGLNPATGTYCETCFLYTNAWNDTRTGQFAGPFGTTAAKRNHYKTDMVGGGHGADGQRSPAKVLRAPTIINNRCFGFFFAGLVTPSGHDWGLVGRWRNLFFAKSRRWPQSGSMELPSDHEPDRMRGHHHDRRYTGGAWGAAS
jgi:hypothetical protein